MNKNKRGRDEEGGRGRVGQGKATLGITTCNLCYIAAYVMCDTGINHPQVTDINEFL